MKKLFLVCILLLISRPTLAQNQPGQINTTLGHSLNVAASDFQLVVGDDATYCPLNIANRSIEPTNPAINDIYLDDGTNTSSGSSGWRRYTGVGWEDIGATGGGSGSIAPGTGDGQMTYWDNTAAMWKHTETNELLWDDVNKQLAVGIATPTAVVHVRKNQNDLTKLLIENNTLGTSARTMLELGSQSGSMFFQATSDNFTIIPEWAGYGVWGTDVSIDGLIIYTGANSADIRFEPGGPGEELLTLDAGGFARLHYHDSPSIYTDLKTDSAGNTSIDPTGNSVLIDTPTLWSNAKLNVGGDIIIPYGESLASTDSGGSPRVLFRIQNPDNVFEVGASGGSGIDTNLMASGVTRGATLKSSTGFFGINTETPDTRLHVVDTATQMTLSHTEGSIESTWTTGSDGVTTLATSGGSFVFPVGNSTNPSVALGDGDTGLFEKTDDTIVIATGGSGRWAVDSSGNLTHPSNLDRAGLLAQNPTSTTPVIVPSVSDPDTGVGGTIGNDEFSLIAGGVEVSRAVEGVTYDSFIISPDGIQNNSVNPSLAFGDGDSGMYESEDDSIRIATGGVNVILMNNNGLFMDNASSGVAYLKRTSGSSTVPVFSFSGDTDSGVGRALSDQVSLIAGGVEGVRITEDTNKLLVSTKGGVERNITTVNAATYNTLETDHFIHVTYTSTGAVTNLQLMTASCTDGRELIIKDAAGNAGTNNITVTTEGAELIDGAATQTIAANYSAMNLYCESSNWYVF